MSRPRPRKKVPMYTPVERSRYVPCGCDPRARPPGADDEADLKLTGGFNVLKSNICDGCKETKSVNGSCSCP